MELIDKIGDVLDRFEDMGKKAKELIDGLGTKLGEMYFHRLTDEELFRAYVVAGRNAKDAVDASYSGDFSRLDALHTWDSAEREWIKRGFCPIHLCSFHEKRESDVANLERFRRDSDFYRKWAKEIKEGYKSGYLPFRAVHIGRISDQ